MAKKNNFAAGWALLAVVAVLAYVFTNKTVLIVLACVAFFSITVAVVYFIKKGKKQESQNMVTLAPKIKIEGYHPSVLTFCNGLDKKLTELYQAQDYIFFIRNYCYGHFFYFVPIAFRGVSDFEKHIDEVLQSDIFPTKGRTHIFLAFKNLGKEEKISEFSNVFKKLVNGFRPNLVRVNELIIKYRNDFRKMPAVEHVKLYEELKSKYDGFEGLKLYEQVCIFEDEYLHEQFDFFEDDLVFEDWWNKTALQILESK